MEKATRLKLAGGTLLTGMLAGIFSVAPAVDSSDFLVEAALHFNEVVLASIFQFVLSFMYMGFGILIYPMIREGSPDLSRGFISFRILAVGVSVVGTVLLLSTLSLSEFFAEHTQRDIKPLEAIGWVLRSTRDNLNHVYMVLLLCIGNVMLYLALMKTNLLARWMSLWGIGGSVLSAGASLLILFKVVEIITPEYLLLNVPSGLFEVFFGGWLIWKGFKTPRETKTTCGLQ